MSRIALVVRRVGGLEASPRRARSRYQVVRRVGGLEGKEGAEIWLSLVVRRVGGLEVYHASCPASREQGSLVLNFKAL